MKLVKAELFLAIVQVQMCKRSSVWIPLFSRKLDNKLTLLGEKYKIKARKKCSTNQNLFELMIQFSPTCHILCCLHRSDRLWVLSNSFRADKLSREPSSSRCASDRASSWCQTRSRRRIVFLWKRENVFRRPENCWPGLGQVRHLFPDGSSERAGSRRRIPVGSDRRKNSLWPELLFRRRIWVPRCSPDTFPSRDWRRRGSGRRSSVRALQTWTECFGQNRNSREDRDPKCPKKGRRGRPHRAPRCSSWTPSRCWGFCCNFRSEERARRRGRRKPGRVFSDIGSDWSRSPCRSSGQSLKTSGLGRHHYHSRSLTKAEPGCRNCQQNLSHRWDQNLDRFLTKRMNVLQSR